MHKKIKYLLIASLLLLIVVIILGVSQIKRNAQAYLYGYPLVLMDVTHEAMTKNILPDNQFRNIRSIPDHSFRAVVRPNNDTLYNVSWLDLKTEPVILSVPDTQERYYVMPLMDAWTNVFAMVGKRTTGTQAGTYAITGPNWQGQVPTGMKHIASPTNMVWLIGRIQLNSENDITAVAPIQEKFTLTQLSNWESGISNDFFVDENDNQSDVLNPSDIVDAMSATEFFSRLSALMNQQAAPDSDKAMLTTLEDLGITQGNDYDDSKLNILEKKILEASVTITQKKLKQAINERENTENSWVVYRDSIGNYATDYNLRAGVALIGLGALPPEEAAYPNTNLDADGNKLSGINSYKIHFAKGQTPPVNAFWSLSMYDTNGYFIESEINRYSIGDRNNLEFNADGSLDIYIQETKPDKNESNWLPAPSDEFSLTMRLYSPKSEFLDGTWTLPKVERIN